MRNLIIESATGRNGLISSFHKKSMVWERKTVLKVEVQSSLITDTCCDLIKGVMTDDGKRFPTH